MIDRTPDESRSFCAWLTGEVRGKVRELTQLPDGDFCADLAAWLIDAGHVPAPSEVRAGDRELATLRAQRDRAWHQLTLLEGQRRTAEPRAPSALAVVQQ